MKLGFIGIGKIAKSVVEALCHTSIENLEIFLSPRNEKNSTSLAEKFSNVYKLSDNQTVLDQSDFVFIALRPDHLIEEIKKLHFNPRHHVVSFVPFIKKEELTTLVTPAAKVTRALPLPAVVNHNCPIPVFGETPEVTEMLDQIGQTLSMTDEEQLHGIWTLTGLISPFYDLLGSLSSWAVKNGVEASVANRYTADLFQSLAFAAQKNDLLDFQELSEHAATPNGLNEQAAKEIKAAGAHEVYQQACDRIMERIKNKV